MDDGAPLESPEFITREIDAGALKWPSESVAANGNYGLGNREYRDLRGVTWPEVQSMVATERELFSSFEDEDDGVPELDDEQEDSLQYLDLGVASATLALSAAGCVPFSSCSGGWGHKEEFPLVAFFCREEQVPLILTAAEDTNRGLYNELETGAIVVYASGVEALIAFAECLAGLHTVR